MPKLVDRQLRRALGQANQQIRAGRPLYPATRNVALRRYDTWIGEPKEPVTMFQFWFRTRGCTFDHAGQCSMCNYGIGPEIEPDAVAKSVERHLSRVPEGSFVYLSPSGSLLDDREVPPRLRERLLEAVAARRPRSFAFETRPELCDTDKLDHLRAVLPTSTLVCQIGVESWDPDVRGMCHLKPTPQESYVTAAGALTDRGFEAIANITLGGLGLSPREAYDDTLASVRGARDGGFTTQMVFPLSAKAGTLLGWAHEQGLWEPPSLWMLVFLLAECAADKAGHDGAGDLDVSWVNPELDDVVRSRPDGCVRCRPMLVSTMAAFRGSPRRTVLEPALAWRGCDCPDRATRCLADDSDPRTYLDRLREIAERWQATHAPVPVSIGRSAAGRHTAATAPTEGGS